MVHGSGFVRFPHFGGMQLVHELEGAFEGQVRIEIRTKRSKQGRYIVSSTRNRIVPGQQAPKTHYFGSAP